MGLLERRPARCQDLPRRQRHAHRLVDRIIGERQLALVRIVEDRFAPVLFRHGDDEQVLGPTHFPLVEERLDLRGIAVGDELFRNVEDPPRLLDVEVLDVVRDRFEEVPERRALGDRRRLCQADEPRVLQAQQHAERYQYRPEGDPQHVPFDEVSNHRSTVFSLESYDMEAVAAQTLGEVFTPWIHSEHLFTWALGHLQSLCVPCG